MRPRGENVHYDDLLDRHEIVVAAKRKLDTQVAALAAELAAAKRQDELHWRTRKSYLDHIAKLEAALRPLAQYTAWNGNDAAGRKLVFVLDEHLAAARACFEPETGDKCVKCGIPLPPLEQWSMPACPTCTSQAETTSKHAGYMGDINGPGCDPDVP